jgi:diadenosine tetraphosphate (Ap4A) HIT family hydrolase
MTSFVLDARLEADTIAVTDLPLSAVRLMDDATYPWLVLVPRRAGLVELTDLEPPQRAVLIEEIAAAGRALAAATGCHKLNIGALGNQVAQLHVHVIARFTTDAAWPNPVWGAAPRALWDEHRRAAFVADIAARLGAS